MRINAICPNCRKESFLFENEQGVLSDEREQDRCLHCGHPHPGYDPDALEFATGRSDG